LGVGEEDVQAIEEGHGFGEGEFGLFEGVQGWGNGIVDRAGKVCLCQVGMQEAAVGKVCIGAVCMAEIGVLEGDIFGDAMCQGDIFQGETHEGRVVEDTLYKINGFGNGEFLFFQVGVHPVDANQLGILEACLLEGAVLEGREAEIAVAEGAILELAIVERGFAEGTFYEDTGGEGFMFQGIVLEGEAFEFLGGVVGLGGGDLHILDLRFSISDWREGCMWGGENTFKHKGHKGNEGRETEGMGYG
jgi:hypothetical protein